MRYHFFETISINKKHAQNLFFNGNFGFLLVFPEIDIVSSDEKVLNRSGCPCPFLLCRSQPHLKKINSLNNE